jgi:hypothetical protein
MGNSFGQTRILFTESFGRSIQANADGHPKYKAGGITVDWPSVPACPAIGSAYYGKTVVAGTDGIGYVEFEDGVRVKVGEKALRYGTVVVYDATLDAAGAPVTDGNPRGAYKPAAAGTLVRSQTFIVNSTVLEEDYNSNHIGVMDGGRMFRARIVKSDTTVADTAYVVGDQSETAIAVYATGGVVPPTLAQIEAAMPLVSWALDN